MITIGITGSVASGKSTVAKLIAKKKHPLFSADRIVLDLYKDNKSLIVNINNVIDSAHLSLAEVQSINNMSKFNWDIAPLLIINDN